MTVQDQPRISKLNEHCAVDDYMEIKDIHAGGKILKIVVYDVGISK